MSEAFLDMIKKVGKDIAAESGRDVEGEYVFNVTELVTCPKMTYLYRTTPIDEEQLGFYSVYAAYAAKLGGIFHTALQTLINGKSEVPVEETFMHPSGCCSITIKGRADIVYRNSVIEIKTFNGSNGYNMFKVNHLMQLVYYMKMLGKGKGFLVYANRCKPEMIVIEVSKDSYHGPISFNDLVEKIVNMIRANAVMIVDWLREDKPAEEITGYRGEWCNYCPFKKMCKKRAEWTRVLRSIEFTKVKHYRLG